MDNNRQNDRNNRNNDRNNNNDNNRNRNTEFADDFFGQNNNNNDNNNRNNRNNATTTTIITETTAITVTTTVNKKTRPVSLTMSDTGHFTTKIYSIFNNAVSPDIPTCIPNASASNVTDSSGAFNNCSIVFTPTALPAIIFRSANTLFNRPTSNAPHMIYPLSFDTVNKVVFGNRTVTAVNGFPSISIGVNVTIMLSPFSSIHMGIAIKLCPYMPLLLNCYNGSSDTTSLGEVG